MRKTTVFLTVLAVVLAGASVALAADAAPDAKPKHDFERPDNSRGKGLLGSTIEDFRDQLGGDRVPPRDRLQNRAGNIDRPDVPGDAPAGRGLGLIVRPTGLSVSVLSHQGSDVIVGVTMTSTNSYTPWHPGRLGNTFYYTIGNFPVPLPTYTAIPIPPGSYFYAQDYTLTINPLRVARTVTYFENTMTASQTVALNINFTTFDYIGYDGVIPGIDFGDGSTIEATTLPLVSSTSVGGGAIRRVYRGTFSHSYATNDLFTIRAATAPTPTSAASPGTVVTASAYPVDFVLYNLQADAHFVQPFTATGNRYSTYITTGTTIIGYPLGTTAVSGTSNTIHTGINILIGRYSTSGQPAQLVATAVADVRNVLEVPTASAWGLLALGGLLAGAGLVLLRRS